MTAHDMPTPDRDPPLAHAGAPVPATTRDAPATRSTVPATGPAPGAAYTDGWQLLPARARRLFVVGDILGMLVVAVMLLVPIGIAVDDGTLKLALAGAVLLLLPAAAAWWAGKRYRYTGWCFDADGFGLRKGRLWRTETRVPATRVQHLDLKRGPLERRFRLSTLVIHTAGTRHSAVSLAGMDIDDAERLRDALARQRDDDGDDGDERDRVHEGGRGREGDDARDPDRDGDSTNAGDAANADATGADRPVARMAAPPSAGAARDA